MRRAEIIIGCSYGDEGKGLAAYHAFSGTGDRCLNVMINGGAQRGHTVDLPDERRHVFHHFGAASLRGALSCADEDYIVNPLLYSQEREELIRDFCLVPALAVSDACRVSTPWDMMLGQIIEEHRGNARHGSCGCGIQETRLRFMNTAWATHWCEMRQMREETYFDYCRRIIMEYIPLRLGAFGIRLNEKWTRLIQEEGLIWHSWQDLQTMRDNTDHFESWEALAGSYPMLIFEAGQGLALDAENQEDFPYLTPSRTTSAVSAARLAMLPGETEVEVKYVTRTYLTRHGAGPLPTECDKTEINPDMMDHTNVPNPHQHSLRYGWFDEEAVMRRVNRDWHHTSIILPHAKRSLVVTHLNETGGKIAGKGDVKTLSDAFDRIYLSDSPWKIRSV